MAVRKPLVIVGGQIEQLQSGDSITPQADQIQLTNDEAGAVVIGTPVYMDAAGGFKKAKADATGTRRVVGLVATDPSIGTGVAGSVVTDGVLAATTAQWDAVAGTTGGLAFGVPYYLDAATAGKLTATAPTSVGQYVVEVGIAISTTELDVRVQKDILL
jgi:hypothetical protein